MSTDDSGSEEDTLEAYNTKSSTPQQRSPPRTANRPQPVVQHRERSQSDQTRPTSSGWSTVEHDGKLRDLY